VAEYDDPVEDTWTERVTDLSAYAGQTVMLAFRYEGAFGSEWFIDDVSWPEPKAYPQSYVITAVMEGVVPGTYTNVANVDAQGVGLSFAAPELEVVPLSYVFLPLVMQQ
jgi:hypothetical protein